VASNGSDDAESSEAENKKPSHPRKKSRCVGVRSKERESEEVEEENNDNNVEQIDDNGNNAQSEDVEQVSLL
jgi:hypothetical protein